jgi:hypothetical protein
MCINLFARKFGYVVEQNSTSVTSVIQGSKICFMVVIDLVWNSFNKFYQWDYMNIGIYTLAWLETL